MNPRIVTANFETDTLLVALSDGRVLRVHLQAYPALRNATVAARGYWKLVGEGQGIHWPSINEDLSLAGMLRDAQA